MPAVCCVDFCKSVYKEGKGRVSFYSFPSDKQLRQLWIDSIPTKNFQVKPSSRLCSLHFVPSDFKYNTLRELNGDTRNVRLKSGAIPSQWHGN